MGNLPVSVLDTDRIHPRHRFMLWRDTLSATHEVAPVDGHDPDRFRAFARGWSLGGAVVIETRASAQHLIRTPRAIRADQTDHYIIRLQRKGRWCGTSGKQDSEATAGNVMMLDMARPSDACGVDIDNINVILPRDMLDDVLPPFDMHGLVLHGAMAGILRSHLEALAENLPHVSQQHAAGISQATLHLVAACLAPTAESCERAGAPLQTARLVRIRRYIDAHLASPGLAPDAICKALGLSRSTLYEACAPHGGVAAFIQRRRLERIYALLADSREHRRISDIAYQFGFVSNAHFSRAFRNAFGFSPRELREGGMSHASGKAPGSETYRAWLRGLTG